MKYTIQVVITTDDGHSETRDIACLEREHLTPTTLGLTLAEGQAILKTLQEVVVERQMSAYLATQCSCAHCGIPQRTKGSHTMQLRTLFGTMVAKSPRLRHCACQPQRTKTYSPLAATARTYHPGVLVSGDEVGGARVLWRDCPTVTGCAADG